MGLINKAAEIYKEDGARGVFLKGIKKGLRPFFETNSAFWFERGLAQELPRLTAKIPAAAELFSADDTIKWIKNDCESWMLNQKELKCGLSENHLFPHLKCDNRIVGYAKIGLGRVYIQDFRKIIALPANFAFIYDTYIVPEYRGRDLAPFLISEVMSYLKSRGVKRIGCHIPGRNTASLGSYAKLGFKRINHIRYFRILGIKLFTSSPELVYSC